MTPAYMVFHLNMAFSSIPEEKRGEVIEKCYHPVLGLAGATGIPMRPPPLPVRTARGS